MNYFYDEFAKYKHKRLHYNNPNFKTFPLLPVRHRFDSMCFNISYATENVTAVGNGETEEIANDHLHTAIRAYQPKTKTSKKKRGCIDN